MNRAAILSFAFLFATANVVAQGAIGTQNTLWTARRPAANQCPVGVEATHGSSLPVRTNVDGAPSQEPLLDGRKTVLDPQKTTLIQRIHLIVTNLAPRDIVSARFTAHGFSDRTRALNAAVPGSGEQGPDRTSSINVVVDVKGNGHSTSDLSLSHFTAVTSVDLDSITYADGSKWQSASAGACRFIPDGMMLIAAAN